MELAVLCASAIQTSPPLSSPNSAPSLPGCAATFSCMRSTKLKVIWTIFFWDCFLHSVKGFAVLTSPGSDSGSPHWLQNWLLWFRFPCFYTIHIISVQRGRTGCIDMVPHSFSVPSCLFVLLNRIFPAMGKRCSKFESVRGKQKVQYEPTLRNVAVKPTRSIW